MKIEKIAIDKLLLDPANARKHGQKNLDSIKGSLAKFGQQKPIVVNADNVIVAGNGTMQAAKELGWKEINIVRTDLKGSDITAFGIADNRTSELAEWDDKVLSELLEGLKAEDFDLSAIGFDIDDMNEMIGDKNNAGLTDPDDVPEPPKVPITKLGDIWQLGNHRLMCGDSTDANSVALLMDGKKADMIFTDPPYGMFLDADYTSMESKFKGSTGGNKYENVIGDHSDFNPSLIKTIFDNFPYCKEVFLWGADYYSEHLPNKNKGSWIVWDKRGDESADKMFGSAFELCWSKTRHKRMLARVKWAGIFGTEKEHDKKRSHPTQKPVALVEWFFEYYSIQGKLNIVDLYGGAGSTLLGSEKLDKKCFTMELDPKYCDVIIRRWEDFTGKKAVLIDAN